jgi:YggT family protein
MRTRACQVKRGLRAAGHGRTASGCGGNSPHVACGRISRGFSVITILFQIVIKILSLYQWAVILAAVMSTLVTFGVLDTRNRLVWSIGDFLYRITEPALRPIRNALPSFGTIDISPIILIFGIYIAQEILRRVYGVIISGDLQGLLL